MDLLGKLAALPQTFWLVGTGTLWPPPSTFLHPPPLGVRVTATLDALSHTIYHPFTLFFYVYTPAGKVIILWFKASKNLVA